MTSGIQRILQPCCASLLFVAGSFQCEEISTNFNGLVRSPRMNQGNPRASLQGSQVHAEGEVVLERLEWPEPAECTCSGHLLDQQTAARCMHGGQGCLRHIEPPEGQQLVGSRVFNFTFIQDHSPANDIECRNYSCCNLQRLWNRRPRGSLRFPHELSTCGLF